MSMAATSLAEASIAQTAGSGGSGKKAPSSRVVTAMADQRPAPEPR